MQSLDNKDLDEIVKALFNAIHKSPPRYEPVEVKGLLERLGKLQEERSAQSLIDWFDDTHRTNQYAFIEFGDVVADTFVQIGLPSVAPLLSAFQDEQLIYSSGAIAPIVLGRLQDEQAVEPLIQALNHRWSGSIDIRRNSLEALCSINDNRAVPPIIAMMERKDEEFYLRSRAAEALGEFQNEQVFEPLIAALEDETSFVRESAAKALAKLSPFSIIPLLKAHSQAGRKKIHTEAEAERALLLIGDGNLTSIPQVVLTTKDATGQELYDALNLLGELRFRYRNATYRCEMKQGIKGFCEEMLANHESELGAKAVLDFLSGKVLLRASAADQSAQKDTLLRPTSESKTTAPDELLRASDESDVKEKPEPKKRRWFGRD